MNFDDHQASTMSRIVFSIDISERQQIIGRYVIKRQLKRLWLEAEIFIPPFRACIGMGCPISNFLHQAHSSTDKPKAILPTVMTTAAISRQHKPHSTP